MNVRKLTVNAVAKSPVLWLFLYFVTLGLLVWALVELFPGLPEIAQPGPDELRTAEEVPFTSDWAQSEEALITTMIGGALTLAGAFLTAIPVAWIYTVTRRQEGYEKAFVQMMLILPVVVAAVARVVRGDLALAFALAGIVAAVRFRTTVRDPKNAVYAFGVIGLGLAVGSGAWALSALISLFFSIIVWALWKLDVGGLSPGLIQHIGDLRLSEALVPGEGRRTVVTGDRALVEPLDADEREKMETRVERLVHHVRADALRKKGKFRVLLLVYATDREQGEAQVAEILDTYASRWQLVDAFGWRHETTALEYVLRFKKKTDVGSFLDLFQVGKGEVIRAAELKPISGLRDRIT